MKRLVLVTGVALGLLVPAATQGAKAKPIYFWGDVANTIKAPGQTSAPLVIRPLRIFLFADGSWDIEHLHWSGWGSKTAHGKGTSSASDGNPSQADGHRTKRPAQITLSNRGQFEGHRVYRCYTLKVPSFPASDQHRCVKGRGGYYGFG